MGRYYTDLFESTDDYNNQYFAHSGVQGMKWGVRRYQNEDVPASNSNNMDTIGPILKSWGLD